MIGTYKNERDVRERRGREFITSICNPLFVTMIVNKIEDNVCNECVPEFSFTTIVLWYVLLFLFLVSYLLFFFCSIERENASVIREHLSRARSRIVSLYFFFCAFSSFLSFYVLSPPYDNTILSGSDFYARRHLCTTLRCHSS